jgi:hypothetical protein
MAKKLASESKAGPAALYHILRANDSLVAAMISRLRASDILVSEEDQGLAENLTVFLRSVYFVVWEHKLILSA